jgi:hypothetical protein
MHGYDAYAFSEFGESTTRYSQFFVTKTRGELVNSLLEGGLTSCLKCSISVNISASVFALRLRLQLLTISGFATPTSDNQYFGGGYKRKRRAEANILTENLCPNRHRHCVLHRQLITAIEASLHIATLNCCLLRMLKVQTRC